MLDARYYYGFGGWEIREGNGVVYAVPILGEFMGFDDDQGDPSTASVPQARPGGPAALVRRAVQKMRRRVRHWQHPHDRPFRRRSARR